MKGFEEGIIMIKFRFRNIALVVIWNADLGVKKLVFKKPLGGYFNSSVERSLRTGTMGEEQCLEKLKVFKT